jgi:hypothetical protein
MTVYGRFVASVPKGAEAGVVFIPLDKTPGGIKKLFRGTLVLKLEE